MAATTPAFLVLTPAPHRPPLTPGAPPARPRPPLAQADETMFDVTLKKKKKKTKKLVALDDDDMGGESTTDGVYQNGRPHPPFSSRSCWPGPGAGHHASLALTIPAWR